MKEEALWRMMSKSSDGIRKALLLPGNGRRGTSADDLFRGLDTHPRPVINEVYSHSIKLFRPIPYSARLGAPSSQK